MAKAEHKDWATVVKLGGPKAVADLLHLQGTGRIQRVQNWKTRGIPAEVKCLRPDLFLRNGQEPGAADVPAGGGAGHASMECVGGSA